MPDIDHIIKLYETERGDRGTHEIHWEEIAERMMPHKIGFVGQRTKGEKRMQKVYDSTPIMAASRFSSVMDSLATPRQSRWHGVRTTNPDINRDYEVKSYFEAATRILFNERYHPKANFTGQNGERWYDLGVFGNGVVFVDWYNGNLRYRHISLKDLYFKENHQGMIDTVFRRVRLTARQAIQKFGMTEVHEKVRAAYKNPASTNVEFEFVHVVMPNEEYDDRKLDYRGKEFASIYICLTGRNAMGEKAGYARFPYSISRYIVAPDEVYGRGPGSMVLPDVKMLNEMAKTDISAAHMLINPPLLLNDDGILGGGAMNVNIVPGGLNFGGVSRDGRQLIQPLSTGARVDIADQKMEQRRNAINDAFLVTLFQILVENPRMTATEVLHRHQEKAMLLTPTIGRQLSESLSPMIDRELELLISHNRLPPMPELLREARGEYEIFFDSPLSRMQRYEELVGVQQTIEMLTPYSQISPDIMDVFDPDELAKLTTELNGVPNKVLRSPKQVAELRAARQAQEQQQLDAQITQPLAGAMKDVAHAQKLQSEVA